MACLSLPPSICYKLENMYLVEIVPGSEEPKLETLNHYQDPLITNILQSWMHGVFITHTALCPHGCLTQFAIAVGVFDLSAGCKAAALASHNADWFCSICDLHRRIHLSHTNCKAWPCHNAKDLRRWAEQ
jgi:hypothetical protein